MIRKMAMMFALCLIAASAAQAQDPRVEISGTAGWTFSDGVNVGTIDDAPIQVGPKDSFSWGARLGFNLTPNTEIGFLFGSQATDLEGTGVINRTIPQNVYNYHGYLVELGMVTLREDRLRSIFDGDTTIEEVVKYT